MWQKPQENVGEIARPKLGSFDPLAEATRLFAFLKEATSVEMLGARSIPLGKSKLNGWEGYRLVPVTAADVENPHLISSLVELRLDANFPGDGEVTSAGTRSWLKDHVIEVPERILFLVQDSIGSVAGHIGLWFRGAATLELDNVVKSSKHEVPWVMSEATRTLGRWACEFIGVQELALRTRPDNTHAISFYQRLGFEGVSVDDEWQTMRANPEEWFPKPETILTAGPSIGPLETSLVGEAIRTGWNHHYSDFLQAFSSVFADYEEAQYVIPTDSCTSALHLSLWALGIGPGDEVIVPDITWVATAAAVRYVGATPIFADVDSDTWCLTADTVREKITDNTAAVIPVHLYGFVAPVDQIAKLCVELGIFMVQDAAPGIGTTISDRSITHWGDATCFSFQGAKLLVSGEGGALVTRNPDLYQKALKISQSGRVPGSFWIDELGKKMQMSNPTAALALAQVFGVERQIDKKRRVAAWYRELLEENANIKFQIEHPGTRAIHWLTSIQLVEPNLDRDAIRQELSNAGIDTRPVFPPISSYPIWAQILPENPNAKSLGASGINLPSGVRLTQADVERVSGVVAQLTR